MKTAAELGTGVIGVCSRCGRTVDTDPLDSKHPNRWVHQGAPADHTPVFGHLLTDEERAAALAHVSVVAAPEVPDDEDEAAGWAPGMLHPAPEVPARTARPEEIPRGAKAMMNLAKKHGWIVEPLYARGTTIEPSGRPYRLYESEPIFNEGGPVLTPTGKQKMRRVYTGEFKVIEVLVLRMRQGGKRAVASWNDGSYEFGIVQPMRYTEPLTSTQIKAFLTGEQTF